MEKIFHRNRKKKLAGVPILISDKRNFKSTPVKKKKQKKQRRLLHNDRGSNSMENIKILNTYAPYTIIYRFIKIKTTRPEKRDRQKYPNRGVLQHPTDSTRQII